MSKKSELEAVAKEIAACKTCDLCKDANPVPGIGSSEAQIMFIGEAPGEKEDKLGEPFVGSAGKFLDVMLDSIGLKRADVFITNIVKHRPPKNRDPKPEEVEICWPFLKKQIKIIEPKLIVILGRHSLAKLIPGSPAISQLHGRAFLKDGQAYMVLYHPAAGLYRDSMKPILMSDFKKIPLALKKITKRNDKIQNPNDK